MRPELKTVTEIVQTAAQEIGIVAAKTDVFISPSQDTRQLAYFCNAICKSLLIEFPWRVDIGTNPWVQDNSGTFKFELNQDLDIPLIDAELVKCGIVWKFLHSKGLLYDEQFRAYQTRKALAGAQRNKNVTVNLNVPRAASARISQATRL